MLYASGISYASQLVKETVASEIDKRVDSKVTGEPYEVVSSIIAILAEAESNGKLEDITKHQVVHLQQVEEKLGKLSSEEEQIDLLKYEYPCLYFYVCEVKGIDVQEFVDLCEFFFHEDPKLRVYYIHGWLFRHLDDLRAHNRLKQGTTEVLIFDQKCEYEGEVNENNEAHGQGNAQSLSGFKYTGTFINNKLHGSVVETRPNGIIVNREFKHTQQHGRKTVYDTNGDIYNRICKNGREVPGSEKKVKYEPHQAYYTKEGKVLSAFQEAKSQLNYFESLSDCVGALRTFFNRFAILATNLPRALNELHDLAQNASQDDLNEVELERNEVELERKLLSLFDQVFPEYSDEPLVKLFESKYFQRKRRSYSKLMRFSLAKIQVFLIISSQDEFNDKLACLMELLQIEDKKIKKQTAEEIIQNLLKMCSSDLIDALNQTGYFSKELMTSVQIQEVEKSAKKHAQDCVELIFKDQNEVFEQKVRGLIINDLQWILDPPHKIFEKIVRDSNAGLDKKALDDIEIKYQKRSEWIIPFVKKQQEEQKIKEDEELQYKLKFLDAKLNQSENSDESDEEQNQQTGEISDKADALYQAQLILPLSNTKISDFLKAMLEITDRQAREVKKQLKLHFEDDPIWQNESNSEIDLEKFLRSSLFKVKDDQAGDQLDWKLLSLFALYTCKQGTSTAIHRIAFRIALESAADDDLMQKNLYRETIKVILEMSSINFIKAVVETGYMEDLFQSSHYEQLQSSIDTISEDLAQSVFGENTAIEVDDWIKMAHSAELAWLFSFLTIREKIFTHSSVDQLHINSDEAEKLFMRLRRQQQLITEKAVKEEMEGQQKEQLLLNFMQPHSQRMNQMRAELQNPKNFQPNEKFDKYTKLALIICNQFYDEKYIALDDLPAVIDDFKNAKHTVQLMGILPENTIEIKDAKYDQLDETIEWLSYKIAVLTRVLENPTGILGVDFMLKGLFWTALRPNAMKLVAPFDSVTIDLSHQDQKILQELIGLQEKTGDINKSIGRKNDNKNLCNVPWRKLKFIAMAGDKDYRKLVIPLNEHEQILLQRYIDAERQEPEFIERGLINNFLFEVFLYIYYAGHGCLDNKQMIVLNERQIQKIFWPAEENFKLILSRARSNCKLMVVFDCCREDFSGAKQRAIESQERNQEEIKKEIQEDAEKQASNVIEQAKIIALQILDQEMRQVKQNQDEDNHEVPKKKIENILKGIQRKLPLPTRSQNYCAVFGTLPNELVDKKSALAVELLQLFILLMINIRQEISVPGCFINFRGKKMKNAVQNETESYALGFGEKSKFDQTTLQIFKEFGAKVVGELFEGKVPRPYFQMIQDYNQIVQELDKAFVWCKADSRNEILTPNMKIVSTTMKQWTAIVFGECGQGKSTTLNQIVDLYVEKYYKGHEHGCKFKSLASFKSVTSCVQLGSVEMMTLIDTPGMNDPDATRSDKNIHIEMINNLRILLHDSQQGLSSLILCMMPNASQRITDSTIKGMNSMFFMFNSLDERVDITLHPRYHIVINNVSKYGENYDIDKVEKDPEDPQIIAAANISNEKRIFDIKSQLKDSAKNFLLSEDISDETRIGSKTWKELKSEVCSSQEYKKAPWFIELTEHEQALIKDLKLIQLQLGVSVEIEPQRNSIRAKFIEERIEDLLPSENFFFFKIHYGETEDAKRRNAIEKREIVRLIDAHVSYDKYYIKEGQIEPQYLIEDERKLLTEGMEISIEKIAYEVYKSNQLTQQITGKPSEELVERMKEIQAFQKTFGSYLNGKPYIFQKFSFHGLILAREILSKARDEVNQHCLEDLAKEISKKQLKIEEMQKSSRKTVVKRDYVLKKSITREDVKQQQEEKVEEIELREEVKQKEILKEEKKVVQEPIMEIENLIDDFSYWTPKIIDPSITRIRSEQLHQQVNQGKAIQPLPVANKQKDRNFNSEAKIAQEHLLAKIKSLEEKNLKLKSENEGLESDKTIFKAENQSFKIFNQVLKTQNLKLKTQNEELMAEKLEKNSMIQDLQDENQELKAGIQSQKAILEQSQVLVQKISRVSHIGK